MIQQAIEVELSALPERFENVKTLHGQRFVRNGYLPEREVLTAAGPIPVAELIDWDWLNTAMSASFVAGRG